MSFKQLCVGFIGGGHMAQAIAGGLLRGAHAPDAIRVAEPSAAQRERWAALYPAVNVSADNAMIAATADLLVLAVKPQTMREVLDGIAAVARPATQLVVSIAAGVPLASLARGFRADVPLVRIMPNQPALVGAGMSVLVASAQVSAAQRGQALYFARAMGEALWIEDETLMDAVTAVSGSGPAYFYLLMEHMERAGVALGLSNDVVHLLVRQTALGAARTAIQPDTDLAALRASVTSPGGTTAAALAVFEQAGFPDTLRRALTAARDRGAELGRASR